jgi:phenylpyruvate tautomerase PptA (4-oxalocrotonate tautomerase family)
LYKDKRFRLFGDLRYVGFVQRNSIIGGHVPVITCDIRVGRTPEHKSRLAAALTRAVSEVTGVSVDHIFLVIREVPGFNFVDAGVHVPDYVPGPDGSDVSGHEQTERRKASRSRHDTPNVATES